MADHTPGPWTVNGRVIEQDVSAPGVAGYGVYCIGGVDDDAPHWEADVRLMAAAPELLAACQAFVLLIDSCEGIRGRFDLSLSRRDARLFTAQALAAIAQATGEATS
ncbi:MAG: hypothetical protein RLZZ200_1648 [Pseudomonadota bacterium]